LWTSVLAGTDAHNRKGHLRQRRCPFLCVMALPFDTDAATKEARQSHCPTAPSPLSPCAYRGSSCQTRSMQSSSRLASSARHRGWRQWR
jgi:hypothetical protein